MTVLIALDGVMRTAVKAPIPSGMELYLAFLKAGRVVILTDGPIAEAEHWLRSHGVKMPDRAIGNEVDLAGVELRLRQVELESSSPTRIVVEADPERALTLISQGIAVLLFAQSSYIRPEHSLTGNHTRRWSEIQDEIERRKMETQAL